MKNKKVLILSVLLLTIILLGIGTAAYFRRTVVGTATGPSGNLFLVVNEVDSTASETFNINIDVTGSSGNVGIELTIARTNLPDNLKFYLDAGYTDEIINPVWVIEKSDNMTLTVPVYWYWDGSIDDENDSLFINQALEATISVEATIAKTLYETLSNEMYQLDTDVDFDASATYFNGQGLMMRNGTQNDEYPIVYYRGNITNNNVIFADLCWLIVRTTETGGTKLIYNGEVNSAGGCNSYTDLSGEKLFAGITKKFNIDESSPIYAGYMYNDEAYTYSVDTLATDYVAHLSDNTIDSETGRHTQNLKDSTVKGLVDDWYEANIKGKPEESLLEDSVWCNDRSVISETKTIENFANGTNTQFNFAAYTRIYENRSTTGVTPSLVCSRDMDKFTVDSENGNGDLDYPIGLLTADEIVFAGNAYGNEKITYLSLNDDQWTMSPSDFYRGTVYMSELVNDEYQPNRGGYSRGIRPSISLSLESYVASGNGNRLTPYIITGINMQ